MWVRIFFMSTFSNYLFSRILNRYNIFFTKNLENNHVWIAFFLNFFCRKCTVMIWYIRDKKMIGKCIYEKHRDFWWKIPFQTINGQSSKWTHLFFYLVQLSCRYKLIKKTLTLLLFFVLTIIMSWCMWIIWSKYTNIVHPTLNAPTATAAVSNGLGILKSSSGHEY